MTLKIFPPLSLSLILLAPFSALQAADSSELDTKMPPPPVQLNEEVDEEPIAQWSDNWGIGIGMRRGDIPYATEEDEVYDTLPLIYFENDYFYINGMEAAGHIWKNDNHQINLYTRFRFVDIPKELQNESQSQAFDFGLQYRFVKDEWDFDLAFLSDSNKRSYGYSRTQYTWESGDWRLKPYAEFQWKSADFNNYYYGLEQYEIGGGVDFNAGIKARYHVYSNLYLLGQFGVGRLEDDVYNLPTINNRFQYESFFGFGFFPEPNSKKYSAQPAATKRKEGSEFVRIAHGWATPSNLNAILKWQTKTDPYNNQMTSAFYGTQLTDSLFNFPIDLYLTPGLVWHHSSEVQDNLAEAVIAVKAFYTFELGPRFRLGVAEGLSYVSNVTHIESSELEIKEYKPSKLLNYLDFSLDVNVGDVFNSAKFDNMWFGYSIHHRSGIFESSSAFGRISGGSNYQTVYLQWHF
ncbi:MipA/OmpV family protein [Shewanella sp. Isolate13]|uniref:MipA/OmpV family protein n=1 Tax=Shewanella sp. Isolate13 TaxID=2908531 RepID=UPI001EFE5228|nr:MipA/OmpV family protein [Shewanella sp. Isolate13]MCG9728678.1 MipA/OmpV family protein [Shewanella sp. Isolate13]